MKHLTQKQVDNLQTKLEKRLRDMEVLTDNGFERFGSDHASEAAYAAINFLVENKVIKIVDIKKTIP
jgi:hypothetical protein